MKGRMIQCGHTRRRYSTSFIFYIYVVTFASHSVTALESLYERCILLFGASKVLTVSVRLCSCWNQIFLSC